MYSPVSDVNVVFVGDAVALHVDDLAVVDRDDVRSLRTGDLGHVLLVALHASGSHRETQPGGFRRERGALGVAFGQLAQFADGHVELLLLCDFALQGRLFHFLRHRPDAGLGVAGVALEFLALRREAARHRVERPLAAVERLLFGAGPRRSAPRCRAVCVRAARRPRAGR